MKRRNFIFCTALSVGSLSSAFASAETSKNSVENNLHQYLSAVGAQGELKFLCDNQLQTDYDLKSSSYTKSGYKSYGLKYYFCSQQSVAICPLVLAADSSGIIDLAVLFFRKNGADGWVYCNTFSGFHLESIIKTLPDLNQNYSTAQLSDLLIPIKTVPGIMIPYTIFTKTGSLRLVVRIEDQKTWVDFSITEKNSQILSRNSMSEHTLHYNSLS